MRAATQTVRVEILTKDAGLIGPDVTGLAGPIQAARVIVTADEESRSHVVVWRADSEMHLPVDEIVAKLFPSDIVSCVRAAIEGETTLSCADADANDRQLFSVASAAATVKRSWGWDEAPTIIVRFTTGTTFFVDPIFDGRGWRVARAAGV